MEAFPKMCVDGISAADTCVFCVMKWEVYFVQLCLELCIYPVLCTAPIRGHKE